jgi:uncharacterized damage-inducible protein DinB
MNYERSAIPEASVPSATSSEFQHLLDTYASEINKVTSVWSAFTSADLDYRPHPRASTVGEILKHQLLSERRFFGQFLGTPEPPPATVLPATLTPEMCTTRLVELARPRLSFFAQQQADWWHTRVPFFDVERERIWIFWRRILHTVHHRTQLTVYLRLLDREVPSTYGPTADVTWGGADPTHTVEAAGRK